MPAWADIMQETASAHTLAQTGSSFHFLRHGQTAENFAHICQGQRDVPLNETGIAQAEAAAPLLATQPIERVVSSDLKRVTMTAQPLINQTGWPINFEPGLRERTFGILEGQAIPNDLWDRNDEGVEPVTDFTNRVLDAVQRAVATPNTLVTAHGGILRAIASGVNVKLQTFAYANAVPLIFKAKPNGYQVEAIMAEGVFDATQPLPDGVTPPVITTGRLLAGEEPA